jgi:hypothetical protein
MWVSGAFFNALLTEHFVPVAIHARTLVGFWWRK